MGNYHCYNCRTPLAPPEPTCPQCGRIALLLGRYLLGAELGKGGFGVVREARDIRLGRRCAVKEIPFNSEAKSQVEREIGLLTENSNSGLPFVPEIYDYHIEPGSYYIVMEFIDGPTLDRLTGSPWTPERVTAFLRTLLGYLARLHDIGIIHRDISPKNIKLTPDGRYVLLDFGIAKRITEGSSVRAFSYDYAPLEQIKRQGTTPQSDLFSLGVTAYHLLTGRLPPNALLRADHHPVVPPVHCVPGCPPHLDRTIMALMALAADDRPADARVALALLDDSSPPATAPVASEQATTQRDDTQSPRMHRIGRGRVTTLAALPDGRFLALGTPFGVYLYAGPAFDQYQFLPTAAPVRAAGFARNGNVLFVAEPIAVRAWRIPDLQPLAGWTTTPVQITALATAYAGDTAVAASSEGLWIWQLTAERPIRLALECGDGIALAADGSVFAAIVNGRVEVRQSSDGARLAVLPFDNDAPELVALDPQGLLCAMATTTSLVVCRTNDGALLYRREFETGRINGLAFSHDGRSLAIMCDEGIEVFRATDGQRLGGPWSSPAVSCNPCFLDGDRLLAAATLSGAAIRRVYDGAIAARINDHPARLHTVACSPDGNVLATMGGIVRLYAIHEHTAHPLREFVYHDDRGNSLAFSPDGALLAAGSRAGVTVSRVTDGALVCTLAARTEQTGGLAFTADGRSLIVLSHTLEQWDVAEGRRLAAIEIDTASTYDIALIAAATAAATVTDDAINVMDLARGGVALRLPLPFPGATVRSLTPAADGRTMALMTDSGIAIWSVEHNTWITSSATALRGVLDLAGRRIALIDDASATLWHRVGDQLQLSRSFVGHAGVISDAVFVPHSNLLATVGHDGALCLWDAGAI
ncbi:MAG: protein kinase [Roseiflexaceae bacterium]|nr:protein kinase [Roseiflexaceae bacterium]